jgi:hypothetical protein
VLGCEPGLEIALKCGPVVTERAGASHVRQDPGKAVGVLTGPFRASDSSSESAAASRTSAGLQP